MDRVVVDNDGVTVLDYKTGDEKPDYTQQLTRYMRILKNFYHGRTVMGVLVYIDRGRIQEVS